MNSVAKLDPNKGEDLFFWSSPNFRQKIASNPNVNSFTLISHLQPLLKNFDTCKHSKMNETVIKLVSNSIGEVPNSLEHTANMNLSA